MIPPKCMGAAARSQRVHVATWYISGPQGRYVRTPLGPKYIPYANMDPLGKGSVWHLRKLRRRQWLTVCEFQVELVVGNPAFF